MMHDALLFVMYRGLALVFDFTGDVSPICQELHDYQRAVVLANNLHHALFRHSRNLDHQARHRDSHG